MLCYSSDSLWTVVATTLNNVFTLLSCICMTSCVITWNRTFRMEQSIEFSCMCSEVILCVAYNFYAASKPDTPLLCGWCEINCNEVLFVNGEKKRPMAWNPIPSHVTSSNCSYLCCLFMRANLGSNQLSISSLIWLWWWSVNELDMRLPETHWDSYRIPYTPLFCNSSVHTPKAGSSSRPYRQCHCLFA